MRNKDALIIEDKLDITIKINLRSKIARVSKIDYIQYLSATLISPSILMINIYGTVFAKEWKLINESLFVL